MTTKKYVLTFLIFFILLALAPILFFLGLLLKDFFPLAFYLLAEAALFFLISAIVFIALNFKKLVSYDAVRIEKKISNIDFSAIELSITPQEICERLISRGYTLTKEGFFYKEIGTTVGDCGIFVGRYCAVVIQADETIDISKYLEPLDRSATTYNVGYVFISENTDKNLEILKRYITETIVDVEVNRYSYKKFFTPIIVTDEKVYYLKAGAFINEYRHGLTEGLKVLTAD